VDSEGEDESDMAEWCCIFAVQGVVGVVQGMVVESMDDAVG
jgi:hypothetical protein